MEKMSIGKKTGFLAVMAVLFAVCAIGIAIGEKTSSGTVDMGETEKIVISADSGFYQQNVEVSVSAPADSKVYYTINCEMPDPERGQLYEEPILLCAEDEEQVYILRFLAVYGDGTKSRVYTRSYFVGSSIADRYDMLVLSIVGEPEELFGYEDGILVPGARYDQFVEENPDTHPGGGVEANYTLRGAEAEREVELMLFDASGEEIFSQTGGIRVAGELSRLNNQKSLRLYARREYDEQNKFVYDFFGDLYSLEDGTLGQEYKRLLLKNSGQDYGYGFVRSELIGRLAAQAGFADTQHVRPVCVYINGSYNGCYWLSSNYDEQYFENRYGEYDGSFVVLEGGDRQKSASDEADEEEVRRVAEFNAQYDAFSKTDLTVEENYKSLREFLDVENYLQYFAIENYVGNDDWPDANVKTYRYEAGDSGWGEGVFDGRYRMLLFDTDYGFGLLFYHETIGCLVNAKTLDKIMYERSPLFAALMQREDCREYFTSYTLDLINGAMSAENVAEQLDALHSLRAGELARTLETDGLVGGLLLEEEVNMETVERNIQSIKNYASARPGYVLQDIQEKFDYCQQYQLTVVSDSAYSEAKVNTVYCDDGSFTGTYLKEIPVTITPCLGPNETFSYWLVDGVVHEEKELVLQGEDIPGDAIEVHLVTAEDKEPQLRIRALAAKGDEDYVELVNLSSQSVSTERYYLSDSEDKYQCSLPVVVLKPGETIRLVGKDNHSTESLGQFTMNFNLKAGETLTLTCQKEEIDSVEIPDMSADGVYVKDFYKGIYVEEKQEQRME